MTTAPLTLSSTATTTTTWATNNASSTSPRRTNRESTQKRANQINNWQVTVIDSHCSAQCTIVLDTFAEKGDVERNESAIQNNHGTITCCDTSQTTAWFPWFVLNQQRLRFLWGWALASILSTFSFPTYNCSTNKNPPNKTKNRKIIAMQRIVCWAKGQKKKKKKQNTMQRR